MLGAVENKMKIELYWISLLQNGTTVSGPDSGHQIRKSG